MSEPHHARPTGFTLIEILIVVVIIGILAAIVVPNFTNATDTASTASIQMNLRRIRNQIEVYRAEHGAKAPTLADIVDQLTLASDISGNTAAEGTPGYPLGPYIDEIPVNSNTGASDIFDGAVGSSAWYYNQSTGAFHAFDTAATRLY